MSKDESIGSKMDDAAFRRAIVRRIAQILIMYVVYGVVLFLSAGRLDWTAGWVYLGASLLFLLVNSSRLLKNNPEVIVERSRVAEGTKDFDKVVGVFYILFTFVSYVIAGLDGGRFGWSQMPTALMVAGVIVYLGGSSMLMWAMNVNPFFSTTVNIQEERGHHTITAGPYQYVRHPGYAGAIISTTLGTPLLFGSWWAFIPAVLLGVVFIIRTVMEDRTLIEELEGYPEYIKIVPHRLLPGVW
jgi:protein-S-isoprenylcysteine O-methyltransferase Ste14